MTNGISFPIMELYSIMELLMSIEKDLNELAKKASYALQASMHLNEIILEKYIANTLPENRKIDMKELNAITNYNYYELRKYLGNNYYRVKGKTINVIADNQYLSEQSKLYCKRLILNLIPPSTEKDFNRPERYIIDADYTAEEQEFINLMINEFLAVANCNEIEREIDINNLLYFNFLNNYFFKLDVKRVYNDILQNKLHAGDNIKSYFDTDNIIDLQFFNKLDIAEKFDCIFNKFYILKCDLETNKNILIKNFINTVLFDFDDISARISLLKKLNTKYPILIELSQKN